MSEAPAEILLVEDSPAQAQLLMAYLSEPGYAVRHVTSGEAALAVAADNPVQVVLLDLGLPDMDGMDVLHRLSERDEPVSVIVVTGEQGSVTVAVAAMRAGAHDFVVKPVDKRRLRVSVDNALERQRLRRIVDTFQADIARDSYHGFIGSSLEMQRVYRIIESAAPSKATVFITGESGTGKEVAAEAIHAESPRAAAPFVPLNCAAIPAELMESELFGHVKGAFTGAVSDRDGAALRAHGGTLFLDEICELDPGLQTKLLRFLQTGQVQKLGSSQPATVDCRIVCATNRDPLAEVQAGRFREDLYYRLQVIPLAIPPLRARSEDVVPIAEALLRRYAGEEGKPFSGFSEAARQALMAYSWPGNVRQLQNIVRNLVVLHHGEVVTTEMLPEPLASAAARQPARPAPPAPPAERPQGQPWARPAPAKAAESPAIKPLWQVEKEAIEHAIAACGGNIPKAAAYLEVSPSTIYRKRQSWRKAEA